MTKKIHNPLEDEHESNPDVMALLGTLEGSANNLVLQNSAQGLLPLDANSFSAILQSVGMNGMHYPIQNPVDYNPQLVMNNIAAAKQEILAKTLEYKKKALEKGSVDKNDDDSDSNNVNAK